MLHKDFQDYLMERCFVDNPQVLDDDQPDFFDDWLCDLDTDDWIKYGNEYARLMVADALEQDIHITKKSIHTKGEQ